MYKVSYNIDQINTKWDKFNDMSYFIRLNFLKSFIVSNKMIKHIFIMNNELRLYAQIFNLRLDKLINYSNNSFIIFISKFVKIRVLYLSNTFLTNIPSFSSDKKINLRSLINTIKKKYLILIIPDYLAKELSHFEKKEYIKIDVEEDMYLETRKEWKSIDDYVSDLRAKYRKKIYNIRKNSADISIVKFNYDEIKSCTKELQILFNQIVNDSKFSGPDFNINVIIELLRNKLANVYGYYINDKLIAFSTEISENDYLYSYYVGFDKKRNKDSSIYGRILLETIGNAIMQKKTKIIFGRTANEYKSNFGAIPKSSSIYVKINSSIISFLLKKLFVNIKLKKWRQRRPFKKHV